jgi:glycosyltransferase involved in cell wall biosynthesis
LCLVTHVCRKNDGQGRVNYEIAKAALKAGWKLTFLGTELADDLRDHPQVSWLKVKASKLPSNLLRYQAFAWKSARLLRRHMGEFDIIHANGFITWHHTDVNTAHFVHSGWLNSGYFPYRWLQSPYGFYQRLFTRVNAALERIAFKQARRVVAVSEKIALELRDIGVAHSTLSVIHNGADLEEFQPGLSIRARFGLPENATLFLFAGDIRTPRKNLDTVLRAIVSVPDCHLAVAGQVEGSPYPALAAQLGVADRVHFLGMIRDMAVLMRSVDVFVFPSRYEAMSLVVLEAMASGLPVITARTSGGAEIIGDAGRILADPDDLSTLIAWMNELASAPELRDAMGRSARTIAENYSWHRMATHYLKLYQNLLSNKES